MPALKFSDDCAVLYALLYLMKISIHNSQNLPMMF